MRNRILLVLILFLFSSVFFFSKAQDFPFGAVGLSDLTMSKYDRDTAASAVVLKEFGEAYISNSDYHLIFKYHVRIKILKQEGLEQANIEIPLYKQSSTAYEKVSDIKASSFNFENDRTREDVLSEKNIFTEDRNKFVTVKK